MRLALSLWNALAAIALAGLLADCAGPTATTTADVLVLGEQHDVPRHQELHAQVVRALAGERRLAAVALEMAEAGRDTRGLAGNTSDREARQALHWDDRAWPWSQYGPAVMAAVRAGVPVFGANLPTASMRSAMDDVALEQSVPARVVTTQQEDVREGHCGLLPESELPRMARIQLARDRSMAETVRRAAVPGKVVVLLTGARHADPASGVALYLAGSGLRVDERIWPADARDAATDCAALRRRLQHAPG